MRFLRFLVVGGVCFCLNLAVLYLGTEALGLHYLVSMLLSIIAVTITGWWMNRKFTFGSTDRNVVSEASRYGSATFASMVFAMALMFVLVDLFGIHYLVASAFIAVGMTVVNFLLHSTWSFKPPNQQRRS